MRSLVVRTLYLLIFRPILTLFIGVKFVNKEIFKDLDQFIIVANHNSHFDTVAILAALPKSKLKKAHTIAAVEYFGKSSFSKGLMKMFFNAILIKRDSPRALILMNEQLKMGKSLILFPEGSRGRPGVISDFKKGIAVLLQRNPSIPFIPVYLDGFGRVLPKDSFLPVPLICKVRFGDPINPESDDIDEIMSSVKEGILSLKEKDQRDRNVFVIEQNREDAPQRP